MPPPVTPEQITEVARLACETYFSGSDKTKRVLRYEMETLRSLINEYTAKQETASIHRSKA